MIYFRINYYILFISAQLFSTTLLIKIVNKNNIINMEKLDNSKVGSKNITEQTDSSISDLKEQIKVKKKCLDCANGLIHYYKGNGYYL